MPYRERQIDRNGFLNKKNVEQDLILPIGNSLDLLYGVISCE